MTHDNSMRKHHAQWTLLLVSACLAGSVPAQTGWPRGAASADDQVQASPLLVDLDGAADGRMEILVPSFDNKLYIYRHDGTNFISPVTLGFGDGTNSSTTGSDGTMSSVAVGDVDGVAGNEIIVVGDNASSKTIRIMLIRPDGTSYTSVTGTGSSNPFNLFPDASARATPVLVNCYKYHSGAAHPGSEIVLRDGDGRVNILRWNSATNAFVNCDTTSVFNTVSSNTDRDRYGGMPITPSASACQISDTQTYIVAPSTENNKVYHWTVTSTQATPWSVTTHTPFSDPTSGATLKFFGSAAIADLDGDGDFDVVAAANNGKVYAWDRGTRALLNGWPVETGQAIFCSPALADIDGDGDLEVAIGSDDKKVYLWDKTGALFRPTGQSQSAWPKPTEGQVFASPILAEIDGQPGLEVIAACLSGRLYAWNTNGTELSGWPKRLGSPVYGTPAAADIHKSDRMAVVAATLDGHIYCFDMARKYEPSASSWPQFLGGPTRLGSTP